MRATADRHHHLRSRLRRRLDAVPARQRARQGRPADADLGATPEGWRVVAAHVSIIDDPAQRPADKTGLAAKSQKAQKPSDRPGSPPPVPKKTLSRPAAHADFGRHRARPARPRPPHSTRWAWPGASRSRARRSARPSACSRLSGLVELRPHRSAVVARPGKPQLTEMFEALARARGALRRPRRRTHDAAGARGAAQRINEALVAAVRRAGDPPAPITRSTRRFHAAIYSGSHNAYLAASRRGDPRARRPLQPRLRPVPHRRPSRPIAVRARGRPRRLGQGPFGEAASTAMRRHIESVHDAYGDYLVSA